MPATVAAPSTADEGMPALRRVERLMGTVMGIDVRDGGVDPRAIDDVFAHLRDVEARYRQRQPDTVRTSGLGWPGPNRHPGLLGLCRV